MDFLYSIGFFERKLSDISTIWGVLRSGVEPERDWQEGNSRKVYLRADILRPAEGNVPRINMDDRLLINTSSK